LFHASFIHSSSRHRTDVATQSASPGWNLGKWADYIELEPEAREKIYNVISLEVTGTKVGDLVLPPKLVRDLDWVENFWPGTRKGKGHPYPKVQLYCLMGVASAWTVRHLFSARLRVLTMLQDWHIDFAGSSVYYHILRGSKVRASVLGSKELPKHRTGILLHQTYTGQSSCL
jgi:F-box/leucine-rich repeat protein 10/11